MPSQLFKPSIHKEACLQDLREGMTPEKCAEKYGFSVRTAFRYLSEIKERPHPIVIPLIKKEENKAVRITLEMGSKDLFRLIEMLKGGVKDGN